MLSLGSSFYLKLSFYLIEGLEQSKEAAEGRRVDVLCFLYAH